MPGRRPSLLSILCFKGACSLSPTAHSSPYALRHCCATQILVTELGDETFIIAAIMAMRHSRLTVYAGAMSALALMTVSFPALSLLDTSGHAVRIANLGKRCSHCMGMI